MTLKELLESLGDRLGILEKEQDSASQPAEKIQTRSVTLKDLAAEIQSEEVRSLADKPSELSVSFDKIIEAAGVSAGAHGWNIERLRKLLLTDEFKNLGREAVQKRILGMLGGEKVEVEDLVRDAIARDQALDSFEKFARKKLDDRLAARQHQLSSLEEKVQEIQRQSAHLRDQMEADQEEWREWKTQKRTQERDLAWTVGFLIDRSVITTDEED
jgi:hypothetical protein